MAEPLPIYPHADQDGRALPYEVVRSISTMMLEFTAVGQDDIAIPDVAEIINIYGDDNYDCYVVLSAESTSIVLPASGVPMLGLHFIPALVQKCIDRSNYNYIAIIGATEDEGAIHIEFAKQWRDGRNIQQRLRA